MHRARKLSEALLLRDPLQQLVASDQWTKTVAKLQSVIGEEVLPVCIGRPFVEGLNSSKPDMAGMIVI
ncbi:MAG: hypothetical protein CMF04_15780 [Hyphomonas sp.]|nr:hypothetical protein [Hyphomonas sp.]